MDTASAYMALSAASLEEVIKPDMQQRYQMEKKNWFPCTDTPQLAGRSKWMVVLLISTWKVVTCCYIPVIHSHF
jgi:hypothetical protein